MGGVADAIAASKVLKSEKTREYPVSGLAKGMKLQMDAQAKFQTMKEDAQDLCYDARKEAGCGSSEE